MNMKRINKDKIDLMRKYFNRIQFGYKNLEKYYHLSRETVESIKDQTTESLNVTDEEYKTIMTVTKNEKNFKRMIVTDELHSKLKKLNKGWGFLDLPEILKLSPGDYNGLLNKSITLITPVTARRIADMYRDLIVKDGEDEDEKCPHINIQEINQKDREIMLARNRARYRRLIVGKTYRIYERRYASLEYNKVLVFEGVITKEYKKYFLGEHNGRVVTFLKNSLYEKDTIVKEVVNV